MRVERCGRLADSVRRRDDRDASRLQQPRCFRYMLRALIEMFDDVAGHHRVGDTIRERNMLHAPEDKLRLQTLVCEIFPSKIQTRLFVIDEDDVRPSAHHQRRQCTIPCTEIDNRLATNITERRESCVVSRLLVSIEDTQRTAGHLAPMKGSAVAVLGERECHEAYYTHLGEVPRAVRSRISYAASPVTAIRRNIIGMSRLPFVRNLATFQLSSIVMMGLGLLSSVLYTRMLGLELFGLYAVVSAFAGLLGIVAAFGQEITFTTFIADATGRKDDRAVMTVMRYFFQASLLAMIVYALLALLATPIATMLHGDRRIGLFAIVVLCSSALQWPAVLLFTTLQLRGKIRRIVLLENMRAVLQLSFSVLFLYLGYGVPGIFAGTLLVSALYVPLCFALYEQESHEAGLPSLRSVISGLLKGDTRPYFIQGAWVAAEKSISGSVHPNLLIMIISRTAGLEVTGLILLAFRLAVLPSTFVQSNIARLTSVTVPRLAASGRAVLFSACLKLITGAVGLNLVIVAGALVIVPSLIPLLYGEQFSGAVAAFMILVLLNLFTAMQVVSVPLLRLLKQLPANIVNLLTGIALSILLYYGLLTLISPLYAASIAILYVHIHAVFIYAYLWHIVPKRSAV